MALLQFFGRSISVGKLAAESYPVPGHVPIASYTATETIPILSAHVGELIGYCFTRTTTIFDGTNADAKLILGDDGDTNRFLEDGDMDEHTVGPYAGKGAGIDNAYLYTTANTIDVVYTTDTAADETQGVFDVWFYIARVFPH